MVQRAPLAVAEDAGEIEDPAFARPPAASCRRTPARCGDRAASGSPSGCDAARSRRRAGAPRCRARPAAPPVSTSTKSRVREPAAQRRHDAVARQQERPPVGVDVRRPPGRRLIMATCGIEWAAKAGDSRAGSLWCAPNHRPASPRPRPPVQTSRNLRESHRQLAPQGQRRRYRRQALRRSHRREHPSRQGHAVTQLDMRRISDGVKVSERYKHDRAGRARLVEDREHTFLYQDGDGSTS